MPLGSKLSPAMEVLYTALIVGLWLFLWLAVDGSWFYGLLVAMGTVELGSRFVEWLLRRRQDRPA